MLDTPGTFLDLSTHPPLEMNHSHHLQHHKVKVQENTPRSGGKSLRSYHRLLLNYASRIKDQEYTAGKTYNTYM